MEHVRRGKLKLKRGAATKVTSRKTPKQNKNKEKKEDKLIRAEENDFNEDNELSELTPAQKRHEELRKKREEIEIAKAASKTYRQRVDELNQYLGSLTEHHDIPRVSAAGNG